MVQSELLRMVFEKERWEKAIYKGNLKDMNTTVLKQMCRPDVRINLYYRIITGTYDVMVFHIAEIPKDDGGKREVWIAEDEDRVFLSIVDDCLMELTRDVLISEHCKSYLSGIGTQEIVTKTSNEIVKLDKNKPGEEVMMKLDLKKYFDTVIIEVIDAIFDMVEAMLGCEYGTEPIINVLRKLYHRNLVFNKDGELVELYGSLMQGCAISGWLADVVLYDVDEMLAEECKYYVRYSDDMMILDEDIDKAKAILERELPKYGVALHPKKCERHTADDWVKFLGFLIKGDKITWSKNRVKKLLKLIYKRTLAKPWITPNEAKATIKNILYGNGDGYSWATSCFSALRNNKKDVDTINNWIMDVIRLCEIRYEYNKKRKANGLKPRKIIYGMDDIGGIGVVFEDDYTLVRGTGTKIKTCKERTEKEIEHYKSVGCLLKNYKTSKPLFETCVRAM